MQKIYGLLGFPLAHSFSQAYFTSKFQALGLYGFSYQLFEQPAVSAVRTIFDKNSDLVGLNVTIPHKIAVIPYLDSLDDSAILVGAVNVVKRLKNNDLRGYNTDFIGLKQHLEILLKQQKGMEALILGNGGAARAARAAVGSLGFTSKTVSRSPHKEFCYEDLSSEIMANHLLIIQTTPLGTWPNVESCPAIPYQSFTPQHIAYDLVYNPSETLFMKKASAFGAQTFNGLTMLHNQAEAAWAIWQNDETISSL